MPNPEELARSMWRWRGQERPPFAAAPLDGQESVWDYPRPPRIAPDSRRVVVRVHSAILADSTGAVRVLETASPPTFYLPPQDVDLDLLVRAEGSSYCEWKGAATYWDVRAGDRTWPRAAWSYSDPLPSFASIRGWVAFYPTGLECLVDGERVRPQPGGFYGGWVTDEIVGPMKGDPGSSHW